MEPGRLRGATQPARPRLPFWFSLAVHGTDAYAEAIETTLAADPAGGGGDPRAAVPGAAHRAGIDRPRLPPPRLDRGRLRRLVGPAVRLRHGVRHADARPGEPAARIVILNPRTTVADVAMVLDVMS